MSLCAVCKQVLPSLTTQDDGEKGISGWEKSRLYRNHQTWTMEIQRPMHSSWKSLLTSLDDDCPICWTIWRDIRSSPIASPDDEEVTDFCSYTQSVSYDEKSTLYDLYIRYEGLSLEPEYIALDVWKTTEKCFKEAEEKAPIPAEHTPVSAAATARHWIEACEMNHPRCIERMTIPENARMPTRLLDVGNSNSKAWCVVETQSYVPYIALSHRWSPNTPRLLRSNYQAYCLPQTDSHLPQNYQEVISICRALSIQYLWIDSLCIVQDDYDGLDFRREAPLMIYIYQHAFLTLAICWEVPEGTIFRKCRPQTVPRPPWHDRPYGIYDCPPALTPGDFAFVQYHRDFETNVTKAPLNRRGWVLQERCLSRRILYLSNDQLYWECDGGIDGGLVASEAGPGSVYGLYRRSSVHLFTAKSSELDWARVVQKYSGTDLTFEQDRLVAISGLAKANARTTGSTYLAGIWLEYWMNDIFWAPLKVRESNSELKVLGGDAQSLQSKPVFLAPSWSWLDFPGSIVTGPLGYGLRPELLTTSINSFQSKWLRPLAILTDSIISPWDSDPFASFDRAILRIRCLLIPVDVDWTPGLPDMGFTMNWWFDYDTELRSVGWDSLRLESFENKSEKSSSVMIRLSRPLNPSVTTFFMPLWLQSSSTNFHGQSGFCGAHVAGLVVQETTRTGECEFYRVGIWQEMYRYTAVISHMISNTIVKQGIGKDHASIDGLGTPEEQEFELKLGDFAAKQSSDFISLHSRGLSSCYDRRDDENSDSTDHDSSGDSDWKNGARINVTDDQNTGEGLDELGAVASYGSNNDANDGTSVSTSCDDGYDSNNEAGSAPDDGILECSLLPHFSTAEWATISLV